MDDNAEEVNLILPSNIPCSFHENKTSHYITVLARPIQVPQGSVIGILSVLYPNHFYNVHPPFHRFKAFNQLGRYSIRIKPGYYDEPSEFIQAINEALSLRHLRSHLLYNDITKKCKILLYKGEKLVLNDRLVAMLGFGRQYYFSYNYIPAKDNNDDNDSVSDDNNDKEPTGTSHSDSHITVPHGPDFSPGMFGAQAVNLRLATYCFYIYTNIVEETLVGDSYIPLLSIIHSDPSAESPEVFKNLDRINWVKLNTNYIQNIEIDVRSPLGEPVYFTSGHLILHLVIKKNRDNGIKI